MRVAIATFFSMALGCGGTPASTDDEPTTPADAGSEGVEPEFDAGSAIPSLDAGMGIIDPVDAGSPGPVDASSSGGLFGSEEEDWPDCLNNCGHDGEITLIDLAEFSLDGLQGTLDEEEHSYTIDSVSVQGPDIDLLGITAAARTMVEIIVEPQAASAVEPLVTTHDGFSLMTYNDDRGPESIAARTVIAAPYLALPFFVILEDELNYENFGAGGGSFVGGSNYGYTVRFRAEPFAPEELGALGETRDRIEVTGQVLRTPGDIHYYRFAASATARPTVHFTRTGSGDFIGVLFATNTIGGQLVLQSPAVDDLDSPAGMVTLPGSRFQVCHENCEEVDGEFVFAVTDWNGRGGDDFRYDVVVEL